MKKSSSPNLPKLDFNVTNRCNFYCHHCCFDSGNILLKEFSFAKIKAVLNDFVSIGGQRIDITGGEPMLRSDIYQIITQAKKLNLKTELVTNGSLLNVQALKKLKDIKLDDIAISLDGSNYKNYSRIRPISKNLYQKIIKNIQLCVQFGFQTKINTVVFKNNLRDLIKINHLAIHLGAHQHGFYYFSPIGRGKNFHQEVADPQQWLSTIRHQLVKNYHKIKLSLETPILEKSLIQPLKYQCFLKHPWHLQILPDGNVYPCAIMAAHRLPIGNLYQRSLNQIWQNVQLWKNEYFKQSIQPLFKKYNSCVDYSNWSKQLNHQSNKKWQFCCLCQKFNPKQLIYDK